MIALSAHAASDAPSFRGINLGGAAMGSKVIPGKHGKNYLWPTTAEVAMYANAGFNTLRVPFLWERMQPKLQEPLDPEELLRLDGVVDAASLGKVMVLIDLHNYGSYRGEMVGSPSVPVSAFENFWSRIATRYKDRPNLAFGLMNEPNKHKADAWAPIAQAAVTAIRKAGAKQLILVPGTRWSGAHSWLAKDGSLSNAEALIGIVDSEHNFAFEMHQYFDSNSSGTSPVCVDEDIGTKRIQTVTAWLRKTGNKGFLGEFGASKDAICLQALENTLAYMEMNRDVWLGWTYWGAAKWFDDYMFNIYPPDKSLSSQMKIIEPFLHTDSIKK